ncbi:hypothetical protein AVEN_71353-1 [Araneus ventricosus]|uniref:Uncharacterized protein n=1 Tax=Araneus ventricosus TaxID=182803 RepID=A0A4Y2BI15_ARAVE|nr:hypothetical protein AVEN_71353-1 [Araneus ventricosus]
MMRLCVRGLQWNASQVSLHTAGLHVTVYKQLTVIQIFLLTMQGQKQTDVQSLICGVLLADTENGYPEQLRLLDIHLLVFTTLFLHCDNGSISVKYRND